MQYVSRLFAIVLWIATSANAQSLPVGSVVLSLGADQVETMKAIKPYFEVVSVSGQPNKFFLYEGKRPNLRLAGGVEFHNGRLSWAQRTWGNFEGKADSVKVSKALYSAIESAATASGFSAVVTTKNQRVPGIEFNTVTFDFPSRRVTMTTSEAETNQQGGKQVGIEESIRVEK